MRNYLIIRIIGIVFILGGASMLGVSYYIDEQVKQGQLQIDQGQKKLDTTTKAFSLIPQGKSLADPITSSGQKKIEEGQSQVDYYSALSKKLRIFGVITALFGVIVVFFSYRKH